MADIGCIRASATLSALKIFCTKDYGIRVDQMPDESYRYVSWKKDASMDSHPDIIIHHGSFNEEDEIFSFENDGYEYQVHTDENESTLTVYRNGKRIYIKNRQLIDADTSSYTHLLYSSLILNIAFTVKEFSYVSIGSLRILFACNAAVYTARNLISSQQLRVRLFIFPVDKRFAP